MSREGLRAHGIANPSGLWRNLSSPELYEHAIQRREARLSHLGPLVVTTGQYTGRSPKDVFIVAEASSQSELGWGESNARFSPERYDALKARLRAHLQGKELFVQDCKAGADPRYEIRVRVISELAWHSLFARNLFIQDAKLPALERFEPQFTVIDAPGFNAVPELDGTRSGAFILLNFLRREVIIGGSEYAGEIKWSIFAVMSNLLLPKGVLSLHCAANHGKSEDDVALFFGVSGTGKTTLSADPRRTLIGDDEHGWGDDGVFNIEGGCHAKVMELSATSEPAIFATTRRFGTVLENVVMLDDRQLDLDSAALTENTRACYPIAHIEGASRTGVAGHPKAVLLLTADALGVLPPIARLTSEQAMYHFLSGYSAKVAGAARGVQAPLATFSTCFGAPFMPRRPTEYAELLIKKLARHGVPVWLVNTGWTGGAYGTGQRMPLAQTRAMVHAILRSSLSEASFRKDPIFGFEVPLACPGVTPALLDPRSTWSDGAAYDAQASQLARLFSENFAQFESSVGAEVRAAAPAVRA